METAALCLRFDLDTFSTRKAFIEKVGNGEYAYLPRILEIGKSFAAQFQFCACGQGLLEYPSEVRALQEAGHSVDSHLHTHRVTLLDPVENIAEELQWAEDAFRKHRIPYRGIGATGMYPRGIDDRGDVIELLQDRGYRWCSSKFNPGRSLEEMQPYWLSDDLLEIPCAGRSDMGWWHYADLKPVHPQNRMADQSLEGFIEHALAHLHRAARTGMVYSMCLHAGALSKHDPDGRFLSTLLAEARRMNLPIVDMNSIRDGWPKTPKSKKSGGGRARR